MCVFFVFFFWGGKVGRGNRIWVGLFFSCLSPGNLKYVALLKSLDVCYFSIVSFDIIYLMYHQIPGI